MKVKISSGEKIFRVFNYIFLTLVVLICLYPMWHVMMGSVSDGSRLISHRGVLLAPLGFSWDAYIRVFNNPNILSGYMNTLFILIIGIILDLIMTSLAAYFFSRRGVMFKKPLMLLVLFTMFFSGGMIPFYLNLRDLHLTNSLWGIIIPFMVSTYNMIILRTSFEAIPESLTEAAKIDGAGHITILVRIVLPLSKAILAVMVLYYGVSIWNGWFWASAILRDRDKYPLQLILREILLSNDSQAMSSGAGGDAEALSQTIKYATIMVATVPILCVYPFLQKYFATGVMMGAVKE